MEEQLHLLRRTTDQYEWKSTAKGDIKFILTLLELNLRSTELQEFEWKIARIG